MCFVCSAALAIAWLMFYLHRESKQNNSVSSQTADNDEKPLSLRDQSVSIL